MIAVLQRIWSVLRMIWAEGSFLVDLADDYPNAYVAGTERPHALAVSGDFTEEAYERAAEQGVDIDHLMGDLQSVALCLCGGSWETVDAGVFVQLKDQLDRMWTFTVIGPNSAVE